MITSFSQLSKEARIWIYPASRKFYDQEIHPLTSKVEAFLKSWFLPNQKVGYTFKYNRFLIVGLETKEPLKITQADALVSFIVKLQTEYAIELLDRMNVCFKQGNYVQYKDLKDFSKLIKQGAVSKNTIVFDNLLENKADFEAFWEVPITQSWYSRFLK